MQLLHFVPTEYLLVFYSHFIVTCVYLTPDIPHVCIHLAPEIKKIQRVKLLTNVAVSSVPTEMLFSFSLGV